MAGAGIGSQHSSVVLLTSDYGRLGDSTSNEEAICIRACTHLSNTATTSAVLDYDLGVNYAVNFKVANYLAIQELKNYLYLEDPVTIRVRASDDPLFGVFDEEVFVVDSSMLVGPENRDFATELTFVTIRQYWRVIIETVDPYYPTLGAISLGRATTFTRCPIHPGRFTLIESLTECARNPWRLDLEYKALTKEDKESFDDTISKFSDVIPLFIYDPDNEVLYGDILLRCYVKNFRFKVEDSGRTYGLTLQLEELL